MSRLAFLITLSIGCVGCEPPARPRQDQRRTDKRSLFGDASLVPTREGERVRRELALAGELTTSLELMALGPVHVDLELRAGHASAVVVAQLPGTTDADAAQTEADVVELVAAVVPELEPAQIHVWLRPDPNAEPIAPKRDRPWALMLVCLGLGLSLGVTLERVRARRSV